MPVIRPDTRIGELLKAYPELLDTLVGYTPAFGKLRNPLLRRTIGARTTLAQAANLGGVDLPDLLQTLREAAGEPAPTGNELEATASQMPLSAATPEPPPWLAEERIAVRLDARPLHAKGQDPLAPILQAAREVQPGEILVLRNSFEPLPLYEVLGERGFSPWARQLGADDWEVFFYRTGPGEAVALPGDLSTESGAPPVASVTIDVSQLTPPEPMQRILEALSKLQPGETLLVRHVQRPMYLYSRLEEKGFAHQTWELGPGHVEILIRVGDSQ